MEFLPSAPVVRAKVESPPAASIKGLRSWPWRFRFEAALFSCPAVVAREMGSAAVLLFAFFPGRPWSRGGGGGGSSSAAAPSSVLSRVSAVRGAVVVFLFFLRWLQGGGSGKRCNDS
jgi:hypothetical protein